jgi:hypothetical protein
MPRAQSHRQVLRGHEAAKRQMNCSDAFFTHPPANTLLKTVALRKAI